MPLTCCQMHKQVISSRTGECSATDLQNIEDHWRVCPECWAWNAGWLEGCLLAPGLHEARYQPGDYDVIPPIPAAVPPAMLPRYWDGFWAAIPATSDFYVRFPPLHYELDRERGFLVVSERVSGR